ncbi:MAG: TonB-dependent receptor [Candidatus Omnitrophica bacterium]|nr:TonB-dependent receptor [Candidatus Omnitrophota bacterium]
MKKPLFTLILCTAHSFPCLAGEIELEQITIKKSSWNQPNQGVWTFSQKAQEASPRLSLEEMIDYSSSIDLRKRSAFGIQQDVSLRGSVFEDTFVNLQGVQINDPQTGHFNLEIPLTSADLEQVEISKNAQKINFAPKRPKSEGLLLKTGFGNHALREQLFSFNFPLQEANSRLSIEHKTSKGDRQDTDFEVYNFSFHSLWEEQDKKVEFLFGSTERDFGADSFYSSNFPHEEEHISQRFFSLLAGLKKDIFTYNNTIYLRRHSDKYLLDRHDPSFYTNYHTTYVYGLKSQLDFYNDMFFAIGIERESIDSTNLSKHYRTKRGFSLGVEDKRMAKLVCDIEAGVDYYEDAGYQENAHFGLAYLLREDLKCGFSFDRLWRAPSFTELFYISPANRGNSDLAVQESDNYELGMDYFVENEFLLSLSGFTRRQKDTIDWVRNTSLGPWRAENVGEVDVYGCDFYSQVRFKSSFFNSFSLDYTYLDLDRDNPYNFSKYVFDYNRHKIVGILGLELAGYSINLIGSYSKPLGREEYITFDIKAKKHLKGFTFELEGVNLFNRSYEELQDIKGPGRLVKGSISYTF